MAFLRYFRVSIEEGVLRESMIAEKKEALARE